MQLCSLIKNLYHNPKHCFSQWLRKWLLIIPHASLLYLEITLFISILSNFLCRSKEIAMPKQGNCLWHKQAFSGYKRGVACAKLFGAD
jgi:hypothetical protein